MKRDYLFEPLQVIWHVNESCNAACKYCFAASRLSQDPFLNKTWRFVVDQINQQKSLKQISIIGGEPLLVKELPLIIKNLNFNIKINIDSNLTIIKERWNDVYKRTIFSTTVDSINEKTNFLTRGHSALKTIEGVKFLLEKKVDVQVIIVVSKHNIESLFDTIEFFLRMGIYRVGISRVRMSGRAMKYGAQYFYDNSDNFEDIKNKMFVIVKKLLSKYSRERILVYNMWYDKHSFDLGYKYEPTCKCALFRCAIDWEGFVYPCELMPFYWKQFEDIYNFKRPNLRELSLKKAFNCSLFKFFRERMLKYPLGCERCSYKTICNHGCRFYAFLNSTVLLAKDTTCKTDSPYDVLGYHYYSPFSIYGQKRWKSSTAGFLKKNSKLLGKNIYDLGCGGGIWSFFLEDIGKRITGIDNNKTMILIAEEYKEFNQRKSDFFYSNLLTFKYKKADSAVLLNNTILHLSKKDFLKLLSRLKSKVKYFLVEVSPRKSYRKKQHYSFGSFEIDELEIVKNGIIKRHLFNKQTGAECWIKLYIWKIEDLEKCLKKYGDLVIRKQLESSAIFLLKFRNEHF